MRRKKGRMRCREIRLVSAPRCFLHRHLQLYFKRNQERFRSFLLPHEAEDGDGEAPAFFFFFFAHLTNEQKKNIYIFSVFVGGDKSFFQSGAIISRNPALAFSAIYLLFSVFPLSLYTTADVFNTCTHTHTHISHDCR